MPELTKRLNALIAALETERGEIMGLLHNVNEDLATLPVRLFRTAEHDRLVTAVSVLMAIADHLGQAISNLRRLTRD